MTKVLKCSAVVISVYIALLTTSIASPLQIIVPAYFYPDTPTSAWDKMTALTGKGVGITAIVNPASGPNTTDNPDYDRAIKAFRAAGGKVVGYVPSGYTGSSVSADSTCRPAKGGATYVASDIVNCAKYYQQFYDLDGIFVDEFGAPASGAPLKQVIAYYQTIYNGLKAINSNWTVFGNPGTQIEEALLRRANKGGADVLITFEDKAGHFPQYRPDAYTKKYDSKLLKKGKFAYLDR